MSIEANNFESLPDERDLLDQFNGVAYQILSTALARYCRDRVHPALEDKPVNLVRLTISRNNETTINSFEQNPVDRETMDVGIQQPVDFGPYARFALLNQIPQQEIDEQRKIIRAANEITLQPDFVLTNHVPKRAVRTDYTGGRLHRTWGKSVKVSTYEIVEADADTEPLTVVSAALFFARDALAYVKSPHFERPSGIEVPKYQPGGTSEMATESMKHQLNLIPSVALGPFLNGKESPDFLKYYQARMKEGYGKACDDLDKSRLEGRPSSSLAELVAQYETALLQVNKLLSERGD